MVEPVKFSNDKLLLLNQLVLPSKVEYVTCTNWQQAVEAIKDMVVRGAPAIGIAGGYALALAVKEYSKLPEGAAETSIKQAAQRISSARPTAVNLMWAVRRVEKAALEVLSLNPELAAEKALEEAKAIHQEDIEANLRMAEFGAPLIPAGAAVLTHCNAGALATGGYGTALGVIRKAWSLGRITRVYADETRPYLQGSRLTAWELSQDGIEVVVLADGAAGYLMSLGKIGCVIVGADRVAANGDVANKIGTYSLACLAKRHGIPFYVAAPWSTFDLTIKSGREIPVEERSETEILEFRGVRVAPEGVRAFNPAFDVTPAELITAIITEKGVIEHPVGYNLWKHVS